MGNETGRLKVAPWSHSPANYHKSESRAFLPPRAETGVMSRGDPRGSRLSPSRSPPGPSRPAEPPLFIHHDFAPRLTFASRGPYSERVILSLSFSYSFARYLLLSVASILFSPPSRCRLPSVCFHAMTTMTTTTTTGRRRRTSSRGRGTRREREREHRVNAWVFLCT